MNMITGEAAGVPFVALPPPSGGSAPLVVTWHMLDAPRTETAMAAALPLAGLPAWRVYLGLPLTGSRMPADLFERDPVLGIFDPIVSGAVAEFPAALAALRERLSIADGPIILVGASVGAFVALSLTTEAAGSSAAGRNSASSSAAGRNDAGHEIGAVALVSPAVRLADLVAVNERAFGMPYPWTDEARAAADRLDFVARAGELRSTPTLIVTGDEDDEGFREPAEQLWRALPAASLVTVPGMAHALAEEPGMEAAAQTPHAAKVDAAVADWLARHR